MVARVDANRARQIVDAVRPKLSNAHVGTAAEDAVNFVVHSDATQFFDFIEQTFKVESIRRVVHDENVLTAPHFEAANLEFRDALDEYRKGHYGDCMTSSGNR